ncbi:peptidoglycan-binding domain-containing protein [Methanobacterium sp.]|uniref:peptidoglycan-binding domain-containing protein n=1 Tax=Methanobacterium sp. TaxID=2164 RepID=UPI003C77E88A
MPISSAVETPNLVNTLDKNKLVNAVSNNAIIDNTTILSKEDIAKLQKWLEEKNLTNATELKLGSSGEQVKKLQTWLKENNFYNGEIDGNFGIDTEIAVKAFQKEIGLKEDGQVGDYTLLAMAEWDEYAEDIVDDTSVSSSSSSEKVYSKVAKKPQYRSKKLYTSKKIKSTKRSYSSTRYRGYTNGMDCWAMSAYLSSKLRSQGYNVRTIQYATSMSSRHRSVQYWNGNGWTNYDYKGNGYSSIYYATGNSKNGKIIG